MDLDKIKRQLKGILAKTESGSGATEAEAASAMEFARRLMLRHQLTESDLEGSRERTPAEIAADTEYASRESYSAGVTLTDWEGRLAMAISKLVGTTQTYKVPKTLKRTDSGAVECDERGNPEHRAAVVFYGPAADVRDARELYAEWATLVAGCARFRFGGALRGPGRSYAEGFVSALWDKVQQMESRERDSAATRPTMTLEQRATGAALARSESDGDTTSAQYAVVVAGAHAIIEAKREAASDWLAREKGVKLKKAPAKPKANYYGNANLAGRTDGAKADFSRTRTGKLGQ